MLAVARDSVRSSPGPFAHGADDPCVGRVVISFMSERSIRLPAWGVFALLAFVVAPSEARAGCSPLVTHRSAGSGVVEQLDPLVLGGSIGRHDQARPGKGSDGPRPCSGSSCSESPPAPAVPSIVPVPSHETWACLCTVVQPPGRPARVSLDRSCSPRAIHTEGGVFRPPPTSLPS